MKNKFSVVQRSPFELVATANVWRVRLRFGMSKVAISVKISGARASEYGKRRKNFPSLLVHRASFGAFEKR